MLDNEYEKMIHYIEGMIADGVQLVHDDNLLDWTDTNIPELLLKINKKKQSIKSLSFETGNRLQNRYSGQTAAVINDDGETVYLLSDGPIITCPLDKLWYYYKKMGGARWRSNRRHKKTATTSHHEEHEGLEERKQIISDY